MSAQDLDLARSIYADFERGEHGALGWAHAEIEFVVADGPEPRSMRGLRAMLQYWPEFWSAWGGRRIVAEEYRELKEGRVLVLIQVDSAGDGALPGRDGGQAAQVLDVRDGMVRRLVTYFSRDRALAELGLQA